MLLFIDFCAVPWLGWLLPLLGLLLGWLLWGRLGGRITELEETNRRLQSRIKNLEGELSDCTSGKAGLDSEISLLQGRLREQTQRLQFLADTKDANEAANIQKAQANPYQEALVDEDSGDAEAQEPAEVEAPIVEESDDESFDVEYESVEAAQDIPDKEGLSDNDIEDVPDDTQVIEQPDAGIGSLAAGPIGGSTTAQGLAAEGPIAPKKPNIPSGPKKNIYAGLKPDNLQVVEGIGPKMNEILNNAGIQNWSDLGAKSTADIRAILDSVNAKRYRIIDPSSWPDQARLAAAGDFESLIKLQKNLTSGRAAGATGETDSKVEKLLIKMGVIKRWKQNDLTAVEGIGPKISGLLQADGITTWRELANAKVERIQGILDAAGKRYKLADPSSWPKQAEMAADGRWDDLDEYQDFLQGGK